MPDSREQLWEKLRGKKLYTKSYDEFKQQFSDPEKIGKLHAQLNNKGLYTKSIDSFNSQFFPDVKKKVSTNATPVISQTSGTPSVTSQEPEQVDPEEVVPTPAAVAPTIPPGKIQFNHLLKNLKEYKQGTKAVADFNDPRLNPLWQQTHNEAPEKDFVTNAVKSTLDFAGDRVPVRIKNAWEKGKLQGEIANILPMMSDPNANPDEVANNIATFNRLSEAIPESEESKKLASEGVLWAFKNPKQGAKALGETIISSLAAQLKASERTTPAAVAIGAGGGSVIPGIGTAAGAISGLTAGQIVAGMNVESSSTFLETLKEAGFPVNDEEALKEAFKNPALIDKARSMGIKRGVPIAIFDLLTAGIGGRLAARTAGSVLGKVGKVSAVAGVEAAGGSAGELAAQVTAGQNIDANAIALEGIAELGAGSPALASEYAGAMLKRRETSSSNENIIKQVVDDKETGLIESKQNLDRNLQEGLISEEDHADGLATIEKVAAIDDKIPAQIKGLPRQKSIALIGKRDDVSEAITALEEQKANVDPAYHPILDEQIKAAASEVETLNKEVAELAKPEEKSTPTIKKNDLVTYTDAEGNVSQVPVESVKGDKAVIGVNKDGIYESVEVPLSEVSGIENQVSGEGVEVSDAPVVDTEGNLKQEVTGSASVPKPETTKSYYDNNETKEVLYHGSPVDGLTSLSAETSGQNTNVESAKQGFWATTSKPAAEIFRDWKNPVEKGKTGDIYPVSVNLTNPLVTPDGGEKVRMEAIDKARQNGNDGVIFTEDGEKHVFVFNPEQIKINPTSDAPQISDTAVQEDVLPEPEKPATAEADIAKVDEDAGDQDSPRPSLTERDKQTPNLKNTKVVDEDSNPLTVYHSTFEDFNEFKDGITYFAEDSEYSKTIASITNASGRSSDYKETRAIKTIPVKLKAERIYELPKGTEMNGNYIRWLLDEDPDFTKKYDAVKGIDLYSDNKIVYAVFDKSNIFRESTSTKQTPSNPKKRKQTKTAYGERARKVLGQEPRNRREAILDYFIGGGRISLDDFKRFTGFSIGKGDGRPYIGFVKKGGAPLDQLLSDYDNDKINDGGDIGSANEIIETLLEFGGSRTKMLAELEGLYELNADPAEMTAEESYYYGLLTDEQREQVDLIRSGQLTEDEINAILEGNKQDELQSYDEYIDELTFEADRVAELAGILDQFTDAEGNVDWDAIYNEIGDAGLSELSNIEKITNGKQDQKSESGTEGEATAENDGGEKNTAGKQAGTFIEDRIKELDGLIKDQKKKIDKTLAGLSKGNDMFAASGVDDGSKNKTLFAKSVTNTEQENIKRITDPLNAELDRLTAEKEYLENNKDQIVSEASAQQEFFNNQTGQEDARVVMNSINPLPALMGAINKFQERYIAQNSRKVEDWLGAEMSLWGQSKNYMKRNASHIVTSIFNGIPRSKENITAKLLLSGGFNKARFDASKLIQQLYDLVGNDLAKIEQVHEMLDPDLYASLGVPQGPRLGSIPLDVQMLHDELRDLLDNIHRRNFALGFIDQATYDKHKGKYVPRLYETFEIPEDVQQLIDEQEKYHPVTKLDLGQFKGRKELDKLSQEAKDALLKDPVYGAVKRLMQLDQNAAIAGYIKQIMTETPHLVITPKQPEVTTKAKPKDSKPIENRNKDVVRLDADGKEIVKEPTELEVIPPPETGLSVIPAKDEGQDIPEGYQLMSGKGYGKLDGKYIPNYLAEDFKGYFMLNGMLNKGYEFFKAYDRVGFRQFLKKSYTVFNPVVQLGNFISNFTFAFSAGIDPVTFASGIPEAYKNLKEESNEFQTLLRHGILGSDIVTTDLMPLKARQGVAAKKQPLVIQAWNKFDEKTSKLYGMSDDLAKMNAFLIFKKQGFTEQEALLKVYEGFQNYATVGKMWDAMSKMPLFGNPFVKFQADLFRIMKNGITKTPLTTSMYLSTLFMMPQIMQMIGLSDGEEDEKEEALRTERKFIPKVPLGFTDIPLVFKTRFGEVNLARFLSPFYLFDTGNDEGANNLMKKLLPVTLIEKQEAGKGNVSTVVGFSDPLLGTLANTAFYDTDFRGKSIKDPEATRFRASGATTGEQIENKLTYLGRSWIPQGAQMHDFFLSQKYGEDFYGRTKSTAQSLMNMVVKVQAWDDSDYKKEATKQLDYSLSRLKSLGDERKNIGANILAKAKIASTDLNEGKISQKQYDARVKLFQSEATKRLDDNQKQQEKTYKEIADFATKYKRFLE